MTEIINLPSYFRIDTEGILEPLLTKRKVFNQLLIGGACLITLYPSTIDELEPSLSYQLMHLFYFGRCLFLPPSLEEPHIRLREALPRVIDEIASHAGQNLLHSPLVITLGCEFPARVHMGMRYYVEDGLRNYRAEGKVKERAKNETGAQH